MSVYSYLIQSEYGVSIMNVHLFSLFLEPTFLGKADLLHLDVES